MERKENGADWGRLNEEALKNFEDYMRAIFEAVRDDFDPERALYRHGGLLISLGEGCQPFLPLHKGYNRPGERLDLPRIAGRFPELLSKIIIHCKASNDRGRLFLYRNGVWMNLHASSTGPEFCLISWSLPRDSWLLKSERPQAS